MKLIRIACLAVTFALPIPACAAPLYQLMASVPLGGGEKWDYLTFDAKTHRLFVAHGTEVTVVDLQRRQVIGNLTGLPGSHGIVIDPATGDIWADSRKKSTAIVFDPENFKPLASVPVVQDADGMAYDPASKTIYVSGGDGHALTPINPATRTAYADIPLGGVPEFFLADGKGSLYVNINDKNEIARIDTAKNIVTARWPTPGCVGPTGLAFDPEKRRLFTSCHGGTMDILNADTGAVITTLPIGKATDAAGYDVQRERAFAANGDGTLTVIDNRTAPKLLGTVQTALGARTMALEPVSGDVLTVTATVTGSIPASTPQGHPHYIFAPGTTKLLIYAVVP